MESSHKPTSETAPAAEPKLPVSPEEYNSFIEGIELRSIRLAKCEVDASSRYEDYKLKPVVEEGATSYSQVADGFIVLHELKFIGRPESDSAASVSIRATFELTFESATPISDAVFSVFKRFNLPVNIWPFFREFVHTVLARVNWPVFLLPALKIGNFGAKAPRRRRSSTQAPTDNAV